MATTTAFVTAEQFYELGCGKPSELIDGVIVEMSPANGLHGNRQMRLGRRLLDAEDRGVGFVISELGCVLRRNPDTVRAPDIAFLRRERVAGDEPPETFWEGAPDLAVEIVSPGDRAGEIQTKIREWMEAGTRQVWIVYPHTKTIHVVRSMQDRVIMSGDDVLDGGEAVPGFSCRVSELFR